MVLHLGTVCLEVFGERLWNTSFLHAEFRESYHETELFQNRIALPYVYK
jgi:hypothetical protein